MSEHELGRKYKDGEVICLEGEEARNMFVIQSGSVDVIKKVKKGEMTLTTSADLNGSSSYYPNYLLLLILPLMFNKA